MKAFFKKKSICSKWYFGFAKNPQFNWKKSLWNEIICEACDVHSTATFSPFNILKKIKFFGKSHLFFDKKFPKLRNLNISVAFYDKFETCYTLAVESFQIHSRRTWDIFTSDIISWQVRVKNVRIFSFKLLKTNNKWRGSWSGLSWPGSEPRYFFGQILFHSSRLLFCSNKRLPWKGLGHRNYSTSFITSDIVFAKHNFLLLARRYGVSDCTQRHFRMPLTTN